jgi:hypothetical protein
MKRINLLAAAALSLSLIVSSCKKDNDAPATQAPAYTVPTTYNFSNVDYSGSRTRLGMVAEIETEMNKGQTAGTVVDARKLKNMFANTGSPFTNAAYNTSGLQIKDQCFPASQADVEAFMDSFARASTSTVPASDGVAGVGTSTDGTKHSLLSANGFNYRQVFSKSIMVALITYQIDAAMQQVINNSVDNNIVVPGSGTAMEHLWDQAFGYWDVPVDFPTNKTGVKYFGNYSSQVDSGLHCNATLMNAFLKGRAAISNKDMATASAQATIIMNTFDQMIAGAAIHELHETKGHFTDDASRNGTVSESWGFVNAMKYNPKRKITDGQINTLLALYGKDLYNNSLADIDNIINQISSIYGFDSFKDKL